jgi:phage shock protein A
VTIELNDDLVALQQASDDAHAEVRRLQEEYGRPTQEGGWTEEQHAAWNAAAAVWRDRAAEAQQAVTEHAAATGQDRGKLEAAVKTAVRHPASEA